MYENIVSLVAEGTNSGKTFLMERLIREFKARGRRIAAVKHSTHLKAVDKEGKDTDKFARGGADRIVLFSDNALMLYELKEPDLDYLVSLASKDVDIVLLEGLKNSSFRKIEVSNPDLYGTPMCIKEPNPTYIAIVSRERVETGLPWFSFDEVGKICDFIEEQTGIRKP